MKWLLRKHLQTRYGDRGRSWIDRAVKAGRIPAPQYPFGNNIPAWLESDLDAWDRAVAAAAAKRMERAEGDAATGEAA